MTPRPEITSVQQPVLSRNFQRQNRSKFYLPNKTTALSKPKREITHLIYGPKGPMLLILEALASDKQDQTISSKSELVRMAWEFGSRADQLEPLLDWSDENRLDRNINLTLNPALFVDFLPSSSTPTESLRPADFVDFMSNNPTSPPATTFASPNILHRVFTSAKYAAVIQP
ncbi:hypothetical protein EYZ11_013180 [Aspergillus tanneri]|uniref:Uncharacterized protein n=1 Tax=Aspergillus tanneri TaxID=1220188 RepID=A0A4S3IYB2_9EURO|nr:hypothetical protein EYZ11_013180 [Aspergillus tanneri]